MAAFGTARSPERLITSGIGSCIAVFLYDKKTKTGGLAHIMLPRGKGDDPAHAGRYADTGIKALIRLMGTNSLTAKIAGGSNMFAADQNKAAITVGKNNIESVKQILAEKKIPVIAEDTGGLFGRTVTCHTDTGAVEVKILTDPISRVVI
jgi:chemotaxis protein CheD